MFHLLAFFRSQTNGATNAFISPVTDDQFPTEGNGFLFLEDLKPLFVGVTGASITRARFDSPSLRLPDPPQIRPINRAAVFGDFPDIGPPIKEPITLPGNESIEIESTNDLGAGSEDHNAILAVYRPPITPAPSGPVRVLRGNSTTAATADVWSTITVTWDSDLPRGDYAVVGVEHIATGAIAVRLNFQEILQPWRPGGPSVESDGQRSWPWIKGEQLNVQFGRFTGRVMPTVEVICNAATADHDIYLHYKKVS